MSAVTADQIGVLLVSLRALANAAPPGPWKVVQSSGYGNPSIANRDGPLCSTGNSKRRTHRERAAFARYVAMLDPEMLRTIADTLEAVAAERDALIAAVDKISALFESEGIR